MGFFAYTMLSSSNSILTHTFEITRTHLYPSQRNSILQNPTNFGFHKLHFRPLLVATKVEETEKIEIVEEERPRFRWVEIGPEITDTQKQAISQLPPKMTKRCKALMKQIICFSPEKTSLPLLLAAWVKIMKPRRNDWLSVLKELRRLNHPMLFEVAELALLEESFEANVRDYTKIIHGYAKQNRLQDAEDILLTMNRRGFACDQVTLTALIHMYSKAGNLKLAEDTFEEMKLLGVALDKRSYGSMIMAYVRAGMLDQGENLLREMEVQEIYAGREVYKALLRAYSMIGDSEGAQRVFDAIQFAGIIPDVKLCGLLINAYVVAGHSHKACVAFENLRRVGFEPSDKCVALILAAYEKESKLNKALDFLIDLERDGIIVGKEASDVLVAWFRRLGVVEEVELVLKEYALKQVNCQEPSL
ncbi:pentatricopeptide repeat-containing protein At1g01970 [Actinidia eriantha]|uniref:pentatricopeptide repeat-containing protein At1g01970 n=1 Tax=Actinidia eriantha TaxID=165200 RepID=UPI002585C8BD|nr:pentatricopeptide repeat-containing protein At1g01970 [Actinidia eriantha]